MNEALARIERVYVWEEGLSDALGEVAWVCVVHHVCDTTFARMALCPQQDVHSHLSQEISDPDEGL